MVKSTANCMMVMICNLYVMELTVGSDSMSTAQCLLHDNAFIILHLHSFHIVFHNPAFRSILFYDKLCDFDVSCGQYGLLEGVIYVSLSTDDISYCYHTNFHCHNDFHHAHFTMVEGTMLDL